MYIRAVCECELCKCELVSESGECELFSCFGSNVSCWECVFWSVSCVTCVHCWECLICDVSCAVCV